jgi:hypothetical protein
MENEEQPHTRNFAFCKIKICGAKTRKNAPCKLPPMIGRNRCRMHGGAVGSGAPFGNQNALKHGYYSVRTIMARKNTRKAVRDLLQTITEAEEIRRFS